MHSADQVQRLAAGGALYRGGLLRNEETATLAFRRTADPILSTKISHGRDGQAAHEGRREAITASDSVWDSRFGQNYWYPVPR